VVLDAPAEALLRFLFQHHEKRIEVMDSRSFDWVLKNGFEFFQRHIIDRMIDHLAWNPEFIAANDDIISSIFWFDSGVDQPINGGTIPDQ